MFSLDIELIEPNHWVAHVRGLPGCFSSGRSEMAALQGAPNRISRYFKWLIAHGEKLDIPETLDTRVAERFVPPSDQLRETSVGDVYVVNAFFESDAEPLSEEEMDAAATILSYQRQDLLSLLPGSLPQDVERVVLHIGSAEWWYWDRLDSAFPREDLPDDPAERLLSIRALTLAQLPSLVARPERFEKMGEFWSGRKLIRRTAWHERDHTGEISTLLTKSNMDAMNAQT